MVAERPRRFTPYFTMKLNIVILVCGQLEATRPFWLSLMDRTKDKTGTHLTVVDNGSADGYAAFLDAQVRPTFPLLRVLANAENVGLFRGCNQGWRAVPGADLHAFIHNDLIIHELHWDERVKTTFQDRRWGLIGFGGAKGATPDGGRSHFMSNLVDAHLHGEHITDLRPCVVLDGLAMIARREMLEVIGGFDESYARHHYYDKDLSLASIQAGYENAVLGIRCQHLGGITASSLAGDLEVFRANHARYLSKWGPKLPLRVA